jgi:hypothetical protein
MAITLAILSAVLMAVAVASVLLGTGLRHTPNQNGAFRAYGWLNSALVFGFLAGYARILEASSPPFPPIDATHWLYYAALAALLPMQLFAFQRRRWALGFLLPLLVATPLLLSWPLFSQPNFPWILVLGVGFLNLTLPHFLDRALPQQATPGPALAFVCTSGTLAIQLGLFARSGLLSELALILAALQGLIWLLSWQDRHVSLTRGYLVLTVLVTTSLGLLGAIYANLTWEVLPLTLALATPLLSQLPFVRQRSPRFGFGLTVGITLFLCLSALCLGVALHPSSLSGSAF